MQSVFVDSLDRLWILDPASPHFKGVVPGGAKLLQIDLLTGKVVKVYPFDAVAAPTKSYLNDVRIDAERGRAYISDSGMGGIVVLNLETGTSRRRLDGAPAVAAEDITLSVGGWPWLAESGKSPSIASDGIALPGDGHFVYFQALTGRTLYRIPAAALADDGVTDSEMALKVERVAETSGADGLLGDLKGNLFVTDLEHDSIRVRHPDGTFTIVVQDHQRLAWPDSLALDGAGRLYVTTSQIHRMPDFNHGADKRVRPFYLYRTTAPALPVVVPAP